MKFLLYIFIMLALLSNALYADREQDSLALVAFYNSTDMNWSKATNWLQNIPIDDWNGVRLNNKGRVEEINLSSRLIIGTIPNEIGNLTELIKLDLSKNNLSGVIPNSFINLKKLTNLNLFGNLYSSFPTIFLNLTQLKELNMGSNKIEGRIPTLIGSLVNLEVLNLSNNLFTIGIPASYKDLKKLQVLNLSNNSLITGIGKDIANLEQLKELNLSYNSIKGAIPKEIGTLENLEILDLSNSEYSGKIPEEIGNLKNLIKLNLAKNLLVGKIPDGLANSSKLKVLHLQRNMLNELPDGFAKLKNLSSCYIDNNQFDFEDLIKVGEVFLNGIDDFSYSPQSSIGTAKNISKQIGDSINISSNVESSIGNKYKWFQQGNLLENEFSNSVRITSLIQANEGTYTCEITNSKFPLLTLYSSPTNLTVTNPRFQIVDLNSEPYQMCEGETIELGNDLKITQNGSEIQDLSNYTILWENLDGNKFGSFDFTDKLIVNFTVNSLPTDDDEAILCRLTLVDKSNSQKSATINIEIKVLKKPKAKWASMPNIEYNNKATIIITSREDWIYKFYDSKDSQIETTKLTPTGELEWQTELLVSEISFWVQATRAEDNACQSERVEIKIIPTSVNDNFTKLESVSIYPNPASDYINIAIDNDVALKINAAQIYDMLGLLITNVNLTNSNNRIDISNFPRGTYFIKIGDRIEKFVKSN